MCAKFFGWRLACRESGPGGQVYWTSNIRDAELRLTQRTAGDGRFQKGAEMRNGLIADLGSGRLNDADRTIAPQLLKDLQDALSGH